MTLSDLRLKHPHFHYQSFESHLTEAGLVITFDFWLEPDISFHPSIVIEGVTEEQLDRISPAERDRYIFNIGLVEMMSYWKTACAPTIEIKAGALNDEQLQWWQELLIKGLGEFFFVNQIDFTAPDFVTLIASDTNSLPLPEEVSTSVTAGSTSESFLIPIGGGKDSVVTIESLKAYGERQGLPHDALGALLIHPTLAAQDCLTVSGIRQAVRVERTLDPLLAELNEQGYLNGHTPFSALVAFLSTFVARLFGYSSIALSNEASSNEGNVMFHGYEINHQYSKTYDFEQKFRSYAQTYLGSTAGSPTGNYFSFLRPLFELQIAKLFAEHPEYHGIFRSCNRGRQTNAWCGECPKCLFAYAILYPFLGKATMEQIFGQDLFAKPELLPIALELLGYAEKKPLECVGTHEENIAAFHLSYERAKTEYTQLPSLLSQIHEHVLTHESNLEARSSTILSSWNSHHFVPAALEKFLQTRLG